MPAGVGHPLWVPGAGGPPGDAEEPSPHELAPNGAIPHGHIPFSQPKAENNIMLKLSLRAPTSPFPSLNQKITSCLNSACVHPTATRTFC